MALLALFAVPSPAQVSITPSALHIPYGPYADPTNADSAETLDFYGHLQAPEPTPVLIEIHGGGFAGGEKSVFSPYLENEEGDGVIQKAWAAGFAVVSVNYPLVEPSLTTAGEPNAKFPKNRYPRGPKSVRRAIQYVRWISVEWNIDPNRVFLIGSSAGGTLALWTAMSKDAARPGSPNPISQQSSRPNGVVFLSTPTRLDGAHLVLPPDKPAVVNYLGQTSASDLEKAGVNKRALAASPAWRATHPGGGAKTSAGLVKLNAAMPLLGVYQDMDVGADSSSQVFPVNDPHLSVMGLLMREALDDYAAATQDPEAQWADLTLMDAPHSIEGGAGEVADAVVDWLKVRAGLP